MQLISVVPSCTPSPSTQVFRLKRTPILGEYDSKWHKQEVKLLRFLCPPFMAAVVTLSPICHPPVSLGQTLDDQKGATLFRRACIGCHDAGGNIIQPGATLFLKDLQRNGVDTEEDVYRITYYGKGRMPGFGENCTPRGQCTFGPRLGEDEIKLLAEFVKSQAEKGWPKTPIQPMGFVGAPLPEFYRPAVCNSVQAKTSTNTNRKRLRDSVNHLYALQNFPATAHQLLPSSFDATPDILPQIQQYQLEMDDIISQHNNKIRLELEERRKQQARLLMAAVGEGVMKKLREKNEQIQTMGKLNLVLQEGVKSLYVENQLWRDLAQTNEAAANSLRTNLEQVLLQVSGGGEEDVESCCGSRGDVGRDADGGGRERMCSICGEREPSVLLLPCRHLCLCGTCGSGSRRLQACPVCKTRMDATLHVNMTSS